VKARIDSRTADSADLPPWLRATPEGALLTLHVQPGARRSAAVGLYGAALKVQIQAPAQEDRANEALLDFIAQRCGVARRSVTLVAGARHRDKRVLVAGGVAADIAARLADAGDGKR
jgi:hypothetical protein